MTFRNNVMCETFEKLYQTYEDFKTKQKWQSYNYVMEEGLPHTYCKCM